MTMQVPRVDRSVSILLAEDDADLRFILSHSLRLGGYSVYEILSTDDMETQIRSLQKIAPVHRSVDVIVSDIHLNGGSVMPLFSRYREFVSDFPVVLITSDKSPEIVYQAEWLGIHGVLRKPFDLPELLSTVRQAVLKQQN